MPWRRCPAIHINKQDLASETGQGRGQVHRGCGFADATFLVGDCDRACFGRLRADRMLQCLVSRRFISDLRAYGDVEPSKIRLMVSVADSIDVKLSGSSGPVMN